MNRKSDLSWYRSARSMFLLHIIFTPIARELRSGALSIGTFWDLSPEFLCHTPIGFPEMIFQQNFVHLNRHILEAALSIFCRATQHRIPSATQTFAPPYRRYLRIIPLTSSSSTSLTFTVFPLFINKAKSSKSSFG